MLSAVQHEGSTANMPDVLIRRVSAKVLRALKARAARQEHSLQQELHAILEEAAGLAAQEALGTTRRLRRQFSSSGRTYGDSVPLIRTDRER